LATSTAHTLAPQADRDRLGELSVIFDYEDTHHRGTVGFTRQ
jgi:hypothetical protein